MIPSKTISVPTQDSAANPINYTGPIITAIRDIGTKNIELVLNRSCSYRVQATSIYKYHKTYPKVMYRK